ncbi:MAG: hypothetical protein WBB01_24165 [Phormidesmis sp.]
MGTRIPTQLNRLAYTTTEACIYPLQDWGRRLDQKSKAQTIVNQKEIRVVGMRRTGNHALVRWIAQQQPGEFCHLNNVAAGKNPYRHKADNLLRYHPKHHKMSAVYRQQANGDLIERDCLLYSYEDWRLKQITQPRFERNRELYLGKSAQCFDVLILRDPFNLFASRLKQNFVATKAKNLSMVEMWLEYAREFIGESHRLSRNLVCVSYNAWVSSETYRRQLAGQLALPFSDAGHTQVSAIGGGSSFDGTRFSGQAGAMDVDNRWRVFAENPAFRQLFQNEALWHYSQQIFGKLPGTEVLRPA